MALIRSASLIDLSNATYLEYVLIPQLGFSPEESEQLTAEMQGNIGGLLVWFVWADITSTASCLSFPRVRWLCCV